jgi:hypothetical protein
MVPSCAAEAISVLEGSPFAAFCQSGHMLSINRMLAGHSSALAMNHRRVLW